MMKKTLFMALLLSFNLFSGLQLLSAKAEGVSPKAAISMEKAKQIALGKVKGQIVSAKVEKDDGITKYEIIVQAKDGKYEVEIDQATGKVLEVEKEGARSDRGTDDDHHDDEHDDDHHEGDDDRYDD